MKLRLLATAGTTLCLLLVGCDENHPMDPPDTGMPVDTGPRPDGGVEPDGCVVDETLIVEPLWIAGGPGPASDLGTLGKPDGLYIDGNILMGGDEHEDYQSINLYDLDSDDPTVMSDQLTPIADLDAAAGFTWGGVSGITRNPDTDLLYAVQAGTPRVTVLRPMGRMTAPHYAVDHILGEAAVVPTAPVDGEFVRPQTARVDSMGRVYITDDARGAPGGVRRTVEVFDSADTFLFRFGGTDGGPTEGMDGNLMEPENLVIDEARDRIYVCDEGNAQIVVYRFSDRSYIRRFGAFAGIPNGIDVDQYGYIYIVDEGDGSTSTVRVFDPETFTQIYRFGEISAEDDLRPGFFNSPDSLIIDLSRDLLVIADQGHHRYQGFRLSDLQRRACLRDIDMAAPARVVMGSTLPVRIDLRAPGGAHDRFPFRSSVSLRAERSDGSSVGISPTSIDLVNGTGSALVTLDGSGEVTIIAEQLSLSARRRVEVLTSPTERALSGTLSGADLRWTPADGVVRITGPIEIPAGSTLVIDPGTLVRLDAGARIDVRGTISARGTASAPIHFYSGDPANTWEQITHEGAGPHEYVDAFITGGGNIPWTFETFRHCCTPVLRGMTGADLTLERVLLSDSAGKGMLVEEGNTHIVESAFHRLGMAGEFHYGVALLEDSHFVGFRGPDDNDGIYLSHGDMTVRRSVIADGDDDGIDTSYVDAILQDLIVHGWADKGISLTGESPLIERSLVVRSRVGIKCDEPRTFDRTSPITRPRIRSTTIADNTDIGLYITDRGGADVEADIRPQLEGVIVSGSTELLFNDFDITLYEVTDTLFETAPAGLTGTRLIEGAPLYFDAEARDYRLRAYSPGYAIPGASGPIGWSSHP